MKKSNGLHNIKGSLKRSNRKVKSRESLLNFRKTKKNIEYKSIEDTPNFKNLPKTLIDSCNKVLRHLPNYPKLVLGANPSIDGSGKRFIGNNFVFLDKDCSRNTISSFFKSDIKKRFICCDLDDIQQLQYISDRFKNSFNEIIMDFSVAVHLKLTNGIKFLETIKKLLYKNGIFVFPLLRPRVFYEDNLPTIQKGSVTFKNIRWMPQSTDVYKEFIKSIYDILPPNIYYNIFIPMIWNNKKEGIDAIEKSKEILYSLIYGTFMTIFKNIEIIPTRNIEYFKTFNSEGICFICSDNP